VAFDCRIDLKTLAADFKSYLRYSLMPPVDLIGGHADPGARRNTQALAATRGRTTNFCVNTASLSEHFETRFHLERVPPDADQIKELIAPMPDLSPAYKSKNSE